MKKRKKNPQYCKEKLKKEEKKILSVYDVILILKSSSNIRLYELERAKRCDIDKYAHMIINTDNFAEKYEYLLSLSPLTVVFYQNLVFYANEKCFESYVLLVKKAADGCCMSDEKRSLKKNRIWSRVGVHYRFSLVVSFLIKQKKERLLNILLKYYNLTPDEECLLLSCYAFYEDNVFLKNYFSKYVLWPEAYDKLCCSSYESLYEMYCEVNNKKISFKYRLRRWWRRISYLFFH